MIVKKKGNKENKENRKFKKIRNKKLRNKKQLKEDKFNEFTTSNRKGIRVAGKVNEITDQKIFLDLTEGVHGYIPKKDFINSSYKKIQS